MKVHERELVVDGHSSDDWVFTADGTEPPFVVFDADQQKNIAGPFDTREEAEKHRKEILAGAEPQLNAEALADWIEELDEENPDAEALAEWIEELDEENPDAEALQQALSKLMDAFGEFDSLLRTTDRHLWERWKAGGKMVSDEFVSSYPTASECVENLI